MRLLTYKDINFFQSDLLIENNFIHAFFTKRPDKNEPKELQNQLNLFSNIHYARQVHGNKVIQVNNTLNLRPKIADSLITKDQCQSLWVYTADCIPILIADIKTRNIAACHCGLKGIKKQVISKTLKSLEGIGSKKSNLIIAIGASIIGDKYQVDKKDVEDLINQLTGKSFIEKSLCINEINGAEIIPLFRKDSNPDKILIDIQAAAILQLFKEGIKQNQIDLNRICTYSNPNLFNSYRRDKTSLRQWSCIYS
jgi:YfiH family protein